MLIIADNEAYIMFDESHVHRCRREIAASFSSFASEGQMHSGSNARETEAESSDAETKREKFSSSD